MALLQTPWPEHTTPAGPLPGHLKNSQRGPLCVESHLHLKLLHLPWPLQAVAEGRFCGQRRSSSQLAPDQPLEHTQE